MAWLPGTDTGTTLWLWLAVEQADEADDRARLTPRDTEEGFGVLALRRAPRARSLSAVFAGRFAMNGQYEAGFE